jgi:ribosome biogenesis GTPase
MTTLNNFGWNGVYQEYYNKRERSDLSVGRILSVKGFKYYLISEKGELETELSGNLLYGTATEDLPKVGDWVFFIEYDTMGYIVEVLLRTNELSRKNPGKQIKKQVLAANVDYALIVQGLDRDFNIMRLDRYLVQLAACAISPVVVLNKVDLTDDPEFYRQQVLRLKRDCPVYFCSTYTGFGLEELKSDLLQPYKTYILIGSSGVGKSSLLNALRDVSDQRTGGVSASTSKGKHTTTTRDLFQLPNGSLMIDTPGMREFGIAFGEEQSSEELFPALQDFATRCRFADCTHLNETGCAVIQAVGSGELDPAVYESYLKLIKEQKRFTIKQEDKKRLGKQFGKITREARNHRRKYKY